MQRRLVVLGTVAFALLVLSDMAHASGTPGQVCAGAKLKATGKTTGARVACHAKAAAKGVAADPTCLAKAAAKLADAFEKAETRGGCATTGDADAIGVLVDSSVAAFVAALRPVSTANRCAGTKLKATGKKAQTKLGCHAKATGRGVTVDPACLARAKARFAAAFTKAEARPPCLTTGDAASGETLVDDLVDGAVAGIPSVTTSTTTTTTTTTTTATMPPVCGNNVAEGDEACDGTDLGTCSDCPGCNSCGSPDGAWPCTCCIPPGGGIFVPFPVEFPCCDGGTCTMAGPPSQCVCAPFHCPIFPICPP